MKHLIYIGVLLLFFTSCMSVEKATTYLQDKGKLAEVCAEAYPIEERVIEGETIVLYDTLTVAGDSVECPISEKPVKVKCPDVKTVVKHTSRVDTLIQENTAKVEMYKQKFNEEKSAHQRTKEKLSETEAKLSEARKYKWYFFIGIGVCIFVLLWPVLKRFIPIPFL